MFFRQLSADEEKSFRAWARANWRKPEKTFGLRHKPFDDIKGIFHPVVQDECQKINEENAVFSPDDPV